LFAEPEGVLPPTATRIDPGTIVLGAYDCLQAAAALRRPAKIKAESVRPPGLFGYNEFESLVVFGSEYPVANAVEVA
jgi:hypothetical protein